MKKIFVCVAVLVLTFVILPCCIHAEALTVTSQPVQEDILLSTGSDAADAQVPDADKVVVGTTVDKDGNVILTMSDGTVMNAGKAEVVEPEIEAGEFKFEPMNFVSTLSYMGTGMIGIFIVIGLIVLSTVILNKMFKEKEEKAE